MRIRFLSSWEPKGPPPPKIDQDRDNRLWMYQERVANTYKNFRPVESVFTPKRFAK